MSNKGLFSTIISKFKDQHVSGEILSDDWINFVVRGQVVRGACPIRFWAANPPDLRQSYSGSGLPFPNPEIAFENTSNRGLVNCDNRGRFEFKVVKPNGYYIAQGRKLIGSQVKMVLGNDEDIKILQLGDPIANRSLKNLEGRPIRSSGR